MTIGSQQTLTLAIVLGVCFFAVFTIIFPTLETTAIFAALGGGYNSDAPPTITNKFVALQDAFLEKSVVLPQSPTRSAVVDIVSIGTKTRLEYLDAQLESWANHSSVRHFFRITEDDDKNPNCAENLRMMDMIYQVDMCLNEFKRSDLARYSMLNINFVKNQKNPLAWYCATARPGSGMGVAERFYKQNKTTLPDYMFVVDDDTVYRIDKILSGLRDVGPTNPSVWAGCLHFLQRNSQYRFSPHGGSGAIFNRGALQRLYHPIQCQSNTTRIDPHFGAFTQESCNTIKKNATGELDLFQEGMTVNELMVAKYNKLPSCFFADVLMGYFVEHFHISDQWSNITDKIRSPWLPLFNSYAQQAKLRRNPNKQPLFGPGPGCLSDDIGCGNKPICHHMTPEMMRNRSWS